MDCTSLNSNLYFHPLLYWNTLLYILASLSRKHRLSPLFAASVLCSCFSSPAERRQVARLWIFPGLSEAARPPRSTSEVSTLVSLSKYFFPDSCFRPSHSLAPSLCPPRRCLFFYPTCELLRPSFPSRPLTSLSISRRGCLHCLVPCGRAVQLLADCLRRSTNRNQSNCWRPHRGLPPRADWASVRWISCDLENLPCLLLLGVTLKPWEKGKVGSAVPPPKAPQPALNRPRPWKLSNIYGRRWLAFEQSVANCLSACNNRHLCAAFPGPPCPVFPSSESGASLACFWQFFCFVFFRWQADVKALFLLPQQQVSSCGIIFLFSFPLKASTSFCPCWIDLILIYTTEVL